MKNNGQQIENNEAVKVLLNQAQWYITTIMIAKHFSQSMYARWRGMLNQSVFFTNIV
jgi:hypothetical protein